MAKKQTKKQKENKFHSRDRIFLLTFPMAVSFSVLMLLGKIPPVSALVSFVLTFFFTFLLADPFLKELEILINYLRQEAEGKNLIQPTRKFKKRREAFKIVEAFNQIKTSWALRTKFLEAQTLTDSAILEQLAQPLIFIDIDGIIVDENRAVRAQFGQSLLGQNIKDVLPDENFWHAVHDVLVNHKQQIEVSFDVLKEGKKNYFKATLQWLPAQTKKKAEAVILLNDITRFKTFEKSQTAFFANASHELKTPLSVLSGFIETLQGPAKDDADAREKFLKIMAHQTAHMTDLVQNLLALSRLELEEQTPPELVYWPDLVTNVFQTLQVRAQENDKKLKLITKGKIPACLGRPADFFRILQNLVDNAIKYGQKKSTVTVTVAAQKGQVRIEVHNKGKAIKADELPLLFERFYRSATTSQKSGTGLGLAIVKELVRRYGGDLSVDSQTGRGTTFFVCLPVNKR